MYRQLMTQPIGYGHQNYYNNNNVHLSCAHQRPERSIRIIAREHASDAKGLELIQNVWST